MDIRGTIIIHLLDLRISRRFIDAIKDILIRNIDSATKHRNWIPPSQIFLTKSLGIEPERSISEYYKKTICISLDTFFFNDIPMCERSEHNTKTYKRNPLEIVKKSDERRDSEKWDRIKSLSRDMLRS